MAKKKVVTKEESSGLQPVSRKAGGVGVIDVSGLMQDYYLVPIVGASPLIMSKVPREAMAEVLKVQYKGAFLKGVKRTPKPTALDIFAGSIHQMAGNYKTKSHTLEFPFVWFWDQHTKPLRFQITVKPGFPSIALKKGIVETAKLMDELSAFKLDKVLCVLGDLMPITYKEMSMVRVPTQNAKGTPIWNHLPAFHDWSTTALVAVLRGKLTVQDILELVDGSGARMGFGIRRPEKNGSNGIYRADESRKVQQISKNDALKIAAASQEADEYPFVKILNAKRITTGTIKQYVA